MATHSSILAWKIPWTEESDGLYSPWGCKESDMTEHSHGVLKMIKFQKIKIQILGLSKKWKGM